MKLDVFSQLWRMNAGFEQVAQSLAALQKLPQFQAGELTRFLQMSKENRAAVNSYLAAAIESAATDEAGRRFRKRLAQERKDEAS